MNRARRGQDLYIDEDDHLYFIDLLQKTAGMFNVRVAAYCLMLTHYHLLVQTPDANLSRFMRHLNGVYTQRYNVRHKCDGTLFRGRYKSILVDADSYLLQLVRYIHRNPLRAGLVEKLDQYTWSSHRGYISKAKNGDWLYKDFVFAMLTGHSSMQIARYKQFVEQPDSQETVQAFDKRALPSILGSEEFVEWIKDKFFGQKINKEVPESKGLAPGMDQIKEVVCSYYQINESHLFSVKRGTENEPRNVAIYLMRSIKGEPLLSIGSEFNLNRHSSVSSVLERTREKLKKDRKFRKRLEEIEGMLSKGQKKT
ncbi:MAG: helix-turn-helix domain-containing protein [Thermodesulfobacteriota bacterium]|nr:helix-turn-helix domain-containing protein [Thermodesulfobacteriota bacterium]